MFRDRLRGGECLVGTWIKTPSPIVVEVLAHTGLDVICLDAEHAPFGRMELDACIHAARAADLPALVRVPSSEPHYVLQALDSGATGVIVPHVRSGDEAESIVRSARYEPGGRGYAGTTRSGDFGGKSMSQHRFDSAAETVIIAQIEDVEAVSEIDAIVAVDGLDALFIGPADLSVSMGADGPTSVEVLQAVEHIVEAALRSNLTVGIFANTEAQLTGFASQGITLFLMQSDHAFLRAGAERLLNFRPSGA